MQEITNAIQNVADAINKDSKGDRKFSTSLLIGGTIVTIVIGINMWNLVTTLADNMDTMSKNMTKMQVDMHKMSEDMERMSKAVNTIAEDVNNMSKDTHNMNKMNPMRWF